LNKRPTEDQSIEKEKQRTGQLKCKKYIRYKTTYNNIIYKSLGNSLHCVEAVVIAVSPLDHVVGYSPHHSVNNV
jgi:hypothetical protein